MSQLTVENKEHRRLQKVARDSKHTWYLRKGRRVTPVIIRKAPHPQSEMHKRLVAEAERARLFRELSN